MMRIVMGKEAALEWAGSRGAAARREVQAAVGEIITDVRLRGDAAVLEYTEKFDGQRLTALEVSQKEWDAGAAEVEPELAAILREAAENIRDFHQRQVQESFFAFPRPGVLLGQRILPLARVGIYVPGGTASYPSTVLMNAIPAKVAGVGEIMMATPPGPGGKIAPTLLHAAKIAGVDRIFKMGGAQAVAALAWGTEQILRVDKIVGPGNVYVAEAKRQVYGRVDIDMIAGPSEILIVADGSGADGSGDARIIAGDLLSQAEHDANAAAVLVVTDETLARAVCAELERQLALLPRTDIARRSLENNGRVFVVTTLADALEVANAFAPEHLELYLDNPWDYLGAIRNAGCVFLGRHAPEALGDYFAGTNHTLPTAGTARYASPLGVHDFLKRSSVVYYTREALEEVARKVDAFARAEGLDAHGRSVTLRFEEEI